MLNPVIVWMVVGVGIGVGSTVGKVAEELAIKAFKKSKSPRKNSDNEVS